MSNKNGEKILLNLMIAALILPLAVMDFAEAVKDNDKKDKKLKHIRCTKINCKD